MSLKVYIYLPADFLNLSEAKLRLVDIINSSEDAVVSKTLDGIITSWNHGAEKMFGYSAEESRELTMATATHIHQMQALLISDDLRGLRSNSTFQEMNRWTARFAFS
jgi:PAS domain S-box-containing protein